MKAKIAIPFGFKRLPIGTTIRTGDFALDGEVNAVNLEWEKWVLRPEEFGVFHVRKGTTVIRRKRIA